MSSLLEVRNLSKQFEPGDGNVVNEVSFDINKHEIFALLGPSGCGKTTSLRIIAGFEQPDKGTVTLNDRTLVSDKTNVSPEKRGIGLVFQDYALFPHLSVLQNVMFGMQKVPKSQREEQAVEMLCMMGLRDFQNRKPAELSGGQQQRVSLARTIAPMPELILMDEPFSNLDAVLRQSTRDEVRAMLVKTGMSALLVTHDQEEALSFADRIAVMNNGKIEQIGTPEEVYYRPRTQFVAQFLGRTNLIFADADGDSAQTSFGPVTLNKPSKGKVLLSIRPEHLTLENTTAATENCGEVVSKDFYGHDITYRVRIKSRECLVHTDNRKVFNPGDRVQVSPIEPAVVLEDTAITFTSGGMQPVL